jgi:hypothetical protein
MQLPRLLLSFHEWLLHNEELVNKILDLFLLNKNTNRSHRVIAPWRYDDFGSACTFNSYLDGTPWANDASK